MVVSLYYRDVPPKSKHLDIMYSPSCHSKPVRYSSVLQRYSYNIYFLNVFCPYNESQWG